MAEDRPAKTRRATLGIVPGQPARAATAPEPGPAPAAAPGPAPKSKRASKAGVYAELPKDLKVKVDILAATMQVPVNRVIGALLHAYVQPERRGELEELISDYSAANL
jgi:hypothetical protein